MFHFSHFFSVKGLLFLISIHSRTCYERPGAQPEISRSGDKMKMPLSKNKPDSSSGDKDPFRQRRCLLLTGYILYVTVQIVIT